MLTIFERFNLLTEEDKKKQYTEVVSRLLSV